MKLKDYLKTNRITQREFSQITGYTQGYISRVINELEILSGKGALEISEATRYQVRPHDLRPDFYPNPTDGLPPEHQSTSAKQ